MTGEEMAQCDVSDTLTMFSYLTQIYEAFKGDIPYIRHPKLVSNFKEKKLISNFQRIFLYLFSRMFYIS